MSQLYGNKEYCCPTCKKALNTHVGLQRHIRQSRNCQLAADEEQHDSEGAEEQETTPLYPEIDMEDTQSEQSRESSPLTKPPNDDDDVSEGDRKPAARMPEGITHKNHDVSEGDCNLSTNVGEFLPFPEPEQDSPSYYSNREDTTVDLEVEVENYFAEEGSFGNGHPPVYPSDLEEDTVLPYLGGNSTTVSQTPAESAIPLWEESDLSEDDSDDGNSCVNLITQPLVTKEDVLLEADELLQEDNIGVAGGDGTVYPEPASVRVYNKLRKETHPVEEELLNIIIDKNLPKNLYETFLEWGAFAAKNQFEYNLDDAPHIDTLMKRMKAKYRNVAGGPPLSHTVEVPGHSPFLCIGLHCSRT